MVDQSQGTTALSLDHYFQNIADCFQNVVDNARYRHLNGSTTGEYLQESKVRLTAALETAIKKNLPEDRGVTQQNLQEIIELASGDWSNIDTIRQLYRRYFQIKNREYDEQELFALN